MRRLTTIAAALTLSAILSAQAHYYVDAVGGSDTNPGTAALPFKSITLAVATGIQDAVIHVGPGTYSTATTGEVFPIVIGGNSTTPQQRVKLLGSGYQTCIIDLGSAAAGAGEGIKIMGSATDIEVAYFSILNGKTSYWWDTAVVLDSCVDVSFHSCFFDKNNRAFTNWGDALRTAIHDNVMLNSANDTIPTNNTANATLEIYNNLIAGAQGKGMWLGDKAPLLKVVNNIVIGGAGDGIWDPHPAGTPRPTIMNNCCFGNAGQQLGVMDPNVVIDPSNITVDPEITDLANGIYTLKTTSPCLEAGYRGILHHLVDDFFGNARVVDSDANGSAIPEIGPYEANGLNISITNFAQGQMPNLQVTSPGSTPYSGFLMIGWRPYSLVLNPFGVISIDPASFLITTMIPVPTPPTFNPLGTLPVNSALDGAPVYIQALGFANAASTLTFNPSGRLDLNL